MKNKCYNIGGIRFAVKSDVPIEESRFYAAFYEPCPSEDADYTVQVTCGALPQMSGAPLSQSELGAYYGTGQEQKFCSCYVERGKTVPLACRSWEGNTLCLTVNNGNRLWDSALFYALNLPELLLRKNTCLLHSSYVLYQGKAVLFSAPKGTGKSTQAALWQEHLGAQIINGDRTVLRNINGTLYAYGTPYCGSSRISENRTAPVKAVVFLEKGKENILRPLGQKEVFFRLTEQCSREYYQYNDLAEFALVACNAVPFYELSCLPNRESVLLLERELWKTKKETTT